MKALGSVVRRKLLNYLETRDVYELANVDEMSAELQKKLSEGKIILDNLKQYKYSPVDIKEIQGRFGFVLDEENHE